MEGGHSQERRRVGGAPIPLTTAAWLGLRDGRAPALELSAALPGFGTKKGRLHGALRHGSDMARLAPRGAPVQAAPIITRRKINARASQGRRASIWYARSGVPFQGWWFTRSW